MVAGDASWGDCKREMKAGLEEDKLRFLPLDVIPAAPSSVPCPVLHPGARRRCEGSPSLQWQETKAAKDQSFLLEL